MDNNVDPLWYAPQYRVGYIKYGKTMTKDELAGSNPFWLECPNIGRDASITLFGDL